MALGRGREGVNEAAMDERRAPALSRLERKIHRLSSQRLALDHVATLIADRPGPVLEVGLGKGRTYDHLRRLLPGRAIFVFDREIRCYPECVPDADHLFLGDFRATLPQARERIGAPAVLAHCDFGRSDADADAELARWLGPAVAGLMATRGYVVSDQPLGVPGWTALAPPEGADADRVHLYRVDKAPRGR